MSAVCFVMSFHIGHKYKYHISYDFSLCLEENSGGSMYELF